MTTYDPENSNHRIALALDLRAILTGLGFTPISIPGTNEEVFARSSTRISGVQMRVYSSIVGNEVRRVGGDSIKVCAVHVAGDKVTAGLVKEQRVFRTGQLEEIAGRVKDRIRLAALDINGMDLCRCGAPKAKSKKGNMYCVALCWKK